MAKAFQDIIDVYVRYNNRVPLDDLKSQRLKWLSELQNRTSSVYDPRSLIQQIVEEIDILDNGLIRLQAE